MAFFDDLSKKLSQTSADVMKKTKDFADTTKLNGMISDEEKRIQEAFRQIGKTYFEAHKDAPDAEMAEFVAQVIDAQEKIAQYNEEICQIKGVVKCPSCGAEIPAEAQFCGTCGAKMPAKEEPKEEAPIVVEEVVEETKAEEAKSEEAAE